MLSYVLSVEALVFVSAVSLPFLTTSSTQGYWRFGLLALLGVLFEEASLRIARLRTRLANYSEVDMTSVWTFAAAMVLPPALIAPLVILVLGNSWLRHAADSGSRPYRQILGASVVIAASYAARGAMALFSQHSSQLPASVAGVLGVAVGLAMYFVGTFVGLHTAIYLAVRPERLRELLSSWHELSLELATLCLGALTALAVANEPLLALFVVPPMFVLQRSVLTRQLEIAATTDSKTGLLNAATWHHVAQQELARAQREKHGAALLIIDMDNFKRINDNFGHLVGDDVLRAVADCLAEEMRGYDSIGRFGGEEFVAVLSDVNELAAVAISERIRRRVSKLQITSREDEQTVLDGLSASIGVACYPVHGLEVEALLHAADAALYAAKRSGRNRVAISSVSVELAG
jgi:diguanylate cyclase (GGDEF)-like protein